MAESKLTIITEIPHEHGHAHGHHAHVFLEASRSTLAKRRWRGTAENGREFGFDLNESLAPGTHFFAEGPDHYVIRQTPEEVLQIQVTSVEEAARLAWNIGNLHFGVQVLEQHLRVTEDPAILQFLNREHIPFERVTCVFVPLSAGASHHHGHAHDHAHA